MTHFTSFPERDIKPHQAAARVERVARAVPAVFTTP